MAQALLHGDQHVGIASSLDEYDAVVMQPGEMEGGREEVAPVHAPKYRALAARQYSCKKDRGGRIVGKLKAPCHLVQCAGGNPAAWKMPVDRIDAEWKGGMMGSQALDLRDARSQV